MRKLTSGIISLSLTPINNKGTYSNIINGTIIPSLSIRYIKIFIDNNLLITLFKEPYTFVLDTKLFVNGKHNLKIITIWKTSAITSKQNVINIYNEKYITTDRPEHGTLIKNIPSIWKYEMDNDNIINIKISCNDTNNSKKIIKTRSLNNLKISVKYNNSLFNNNTNNITINNVNKGVYYIQIISDNSGEYDLIIQPDYKQQNNNQIITNKYAVIIGISDYMYINDLEYCDEDAVSWCNYLKSYNIKLLGDMSSSYDPYKPILQATEKNIRDTINSIADTIKENDIFVLVTSGHGSGNSKGYSWICCLDENGIPQGEYDCYEMAKDLKKFTDKGAYVFVFCDNCYSGGIIDDILNICDNSKIYITTTCSDKGFGFDSEKYKHGLWTYTFLVNTLMNDPNIKTLGEAFVHAVAMYPYDGINKPLSGGNSQIMI